MKTAYIEDGVVREIIPEGAHPVAKWYNEDFASHCNAVPDDVEPNWEFDIKTQTWVPPGSNASKTFLDIAVEFVNRI